jgi:hypothetical protein
MINEIPSGFKIESKERKEKKTAKITLSLSFV